nr:MAG TPA: Helicase conserved C-terminal domain [Caudoviricetes sp.]
MSDGIHIRGRRTWEEPEKPGRTLRTATDQDRRRRRRWGRLRTGSAGERQRAGRGGRPG